MEAEDGEHREEGDAVEGAQVRQRDEVAERVAPREQMVEEEKDAAVDGEPETVHGRQVPAEEECRAEEVEEDEPEDVFL